MAASATTALQPDESVIHLITSPYTNGLTGIINPHSAKSSECLMAMPSPAANVVNRTVGVAGHGEVICSSMTSPPITPPQVGSSSMSSYPAQLTTQSSVLLTQQNIKDGSTIPSSAKIVLSNSQAASNSQVQQSSYIPIPSPTMVYPSPAVGLPASMPISKPSFAINPQANNQSHAALQTPQQHQYSTKHYTPTSPTIMSPPVTPYLDSQIVYIPTTAAATNLLTDLSSQTYNQMFPGMYGSSSSHSSVPTFPPPQSIHPIVSNATSAGLDFTSNGSFYPNPFPVSNNPTDHVQYLNIKNGGGGGSSYISPCTIPPSPYLGYPQPPNLISSPASMHVTSDRSVYSSTLSEVSYK